MDFLLDDGLKTATHFLVKSGEFFPFAVAKTASGELRHVQALMDNDRPTAKEVLDVLVPRLREEANSGFYVATAIITNVEWTDKQTGEVSDAIRVDVENAGCDPVTCYLPYGINAGELIVGEVRATAGTKAVFPT